MDLGFRIYQIERISGKIPSDLGNSTQTALHVHVCGVWCHRSSRGVSVMPSNSLCGLLAGKSSQALPARLCLANLNSRGSVCTETGTLRLVQRLWVRLPRSSPQLPSASCAFPRGSVAKQSDEHNKDRPKGELDRVF